jgi:hypothetical protein
MKFFRLIFLNLLLVLMSSFNLNSNKELKSSTKTNAIDLPNFDCDTTFTVDSLTSISQLKETFRLHAKNDLTINPRIYSVVISSYVLYFKFVFKNSKISTNSHTFILDEHLLLSSKLLRSSLFKWMNKQKIEIGFYEIPLDTTSSLILIENNDFCVIKLIEFQKIYEDVLNRYTHAKYGNINSKDLITRSKIKRLSTLVYQIVTLN